MKFTMIAILLAASATVAIAADEPSAPVLREKCGADIRKICAGVKAGEGRIVQCLQQNQEKLSNGCKDALNAMRRPIERPSNARPN